MNTKIRRVAVVLTAFFIVSCGGGGGGGTDGGPQTATGVFKDSTVAGVQFISGSQSGITDSDGSFTYKVGEDVTFSVGKVTIGTATGKALVTPIDLVPSGSSTSSQVQNIVRFLMMLDSDGDPENGIAISPAVRTMAENWAQIDFATTNLDVAVTTILSDATSVDGVAHSLPSASSATAHFEDTFRCIYSGIYRGTFSGDDSGHFGAWVSPDDGAVTVIALNPNTLAGGTLTGTVPLSIDGEATFTGGQDPGLAFSGHLSSPNHMEGSWDYSVFGKSGSFTGNRIGETASSSIVYRFSGIYSGASLTAVDAGFFGINVDVSDNITGVAYSAMTNEEFTLTGSVSGTAVSATASNGTTITGTLDKTSGDMDGNFDNPGNDLSGLYVGSGCKLN